TLMRALTSPSLHSHPRSFPTRRSSDLIFLVVTYRKYIEYERERLLGDDEAAVEKYAEDQLTEVPEDFLAPTAKQRPEAAEVFEDHRRREARSAPLPAQEDRRQRQSDEG